MKTRRTFTRFTAWLLCICMLIGQPASAAAAFKLPANLRFIEEDAFLSDESITGLIVLSDHLEEVGANAFSGTGMYALEVPAKTLSIAEQGFAPYAYLYVHGEPLSMSDRDIENAKFVFAPSGSRVYVQCMANGFPVIDPASLVLEDGFYYQITASGAKLLCARDATTLPASVTIPETVNGLTVETISENAFFGGNSLTAISLPYGVTVEDGAFSACPNASVTYYGEPQLPLSATLARTDAETTTAYVDETAAWNVSVTGGVAPYKVKFSVSCDGALLTSGSYTEATDFSYTFPFEGEYVFTATVLDSEFNTFTITSEPITVSLLMASIASVTHDCETNSPLRGTLVTWTVMPEAGTPPYQYGFTLKRDGVNYATQAYSESSTFSATLDDVGSYVLTVRMKDANNTIDVFEAQPVIVLPPQIMNVSADVETLYTEQEITWTAQLSDVLEPYTCTMTLSEDGKTLATATGTSLAYTFTQPGSYELSVEITDESGMVVSSYIYQPAIAYRPVEITGITSSITESICKNDSVDFTVTLSDVLGQYSLVYEMTDATDVAEETVVATQTLTDLETPFTYTFPAAGEYRLDVYVTPSTDDLALAVGHASATYTVGYHPLAITSLTNDTLENIASTGETITWTVTATGGDEDYSYLYLLSRDGEEVEFVNYGADNTFSYMPLDAGEYTLEARVRDGLMTVATLTSEPVTVTQHPLEITAFTADAAVYLGEAAAFTVTAEGGRLPLSYSFEVTDPTGEEQFALQRFSAKNTFSFTADAAGEYIVTATVRDSAGTTLSQSETLSVCSPLTITALTVDPVDLYVNEITRFTAHTEGGIAPLSYVFDVYTPYGAPFWRHATGADNTTAFRPNIIDTYTVVVTVTDARGATVQHQETLGVYEPFTANLSTAHSVIPLHMVASYAFNAHGGKGPHNYEFTVLDPDGMPVEVQNTAAGFTFSTNKIGEYAVTATATDAIGTVLTLSDTLTVCLVSVVSDSPDAIYTGESAIFSIEVTEGFEPVTYAFSVTNTTNNDTEPFIEQAASEVNSFIFTPEAAGAYVISGMAYDSNGYGIGGGAALDAFAPLSNATLMEPEQNALVGETVLVMFYGYTGGIEPFDYAFEALDTEGNVVFAKSFDSENAFYFAPTTTGDLTINATVRDARGSTATASGIVHVCEELVISELRVDPSELYCYEDTTVTVSVEGGMSPNIYLYNFEIRDADGNLCWTHNEQTENNESTFTFNAELTGSFTVTASVTDAYGIEVTQSAMLSVYEPFFTHLIPSQFATLLGEEAVFTASVQGGKAPFTYQFRALDSDGKRVAMQNFSEADTFTFLPEKLGNYTVELITRDALGTETVMHESFDVYETMTIEDLMADVDEIRAKNDVYWSFYLPYAHYDPSITWNVLCDGEIEATIENNYFELIYAPQNMGLYTVEVTVDDGVEVATASGAPVNVLRAYTPLSDLYLATYLGTYGVAGYMGSDEYLVIPPTDANGKTIAGVHANAIRNKPSIVSVELPDTITYLGQNAFGGCPNLKEVKLPARWTTTELYNESANITTGPFAGTAIEHITVPSTMTFIPKAAFGGMTNLKSITLHNGITSIGNFAFNYCSSLTDITLPANLTAIGARTFYGCTSLTSINYPAKLERIYEGISGSSYNYIYEGPFSGSGITSITVPEGVTALPNYIFSDMPSVKTISLPSTLTSIGETKAFYNCPSLEEITLASGNTSFVLHDGALMNAAKTKIYCYPQSRSGAFALPETITSLSTAQFKNCVNLQSVTLHGGVTTINNEAFMGCTNLTQVTLNEGTTTIYPSAFKNCSSLTSINLPSTLTSIFSNAFENCTSLAVISIPSSVTDIRDYVFKGCTNLTIRCESGSAAYNYAIKYGIPTLTTAGATDFSYSISNSTCTINKYLGSSSIVIIPETIEGARVTTIAANAFKDNTTVTEIYIPDGVKNVGLLAFANCTSLKLLRVPSSIYGIETNSVTNTPSDMIVYGPPHAVTANFANVSRHVFLPCEKNGNEWTITDGGYYWFENKTLKIPATLCGYPVTAITDDAFRADMREFKLSGVVIPEGVKSIGKHAFYNCTTLKSVTLPDSVTSISTMAFGNCTALTEITLPNNWTDAPSVTFEAGPFTGSALTHVTIPTGMTSIPNYAFAGMTQLASVSLHDGIESMGYGAFYGCSALTQITLPKNLTELKLAAFYGCSSLTEITLPEGFTTLGARAFACCSALESVSIPASVTRIGDGAFWACSSLTSVVVPEGITAIEMDTFSQCTNLTNVTLPSTLTSIGDMAFCGSNRLGTLILPAGVTAFGVSPFSTENSNLVLCVAENSPALTHAKNNSISHITYALNPDTQTAAIVSASGALTNVVIPDEIFGYPVTAIGAYAFKGNMTLASVTLPEGITTIGSYAFQSCTALKTISLPQTLTTLEDAAFMQCSALTSVELPDSLTTLDVGIFVGCSSLAQVTLPQTLTTIGDSAFFSCALTAITLPDTLTMIGVSAFSNNKLTEVVIPERVTSIGISAFSGNANLAKAVIPASVTSIGASAFTNGAATPLTIYCESGSEAYDYAVANSLQLFADGLTYTVADAACTITGYIGSNGDVIIPESIDGLPVTTIGYQAFRHNQTLASVSIPESVTTIEMDAFYRCANLERVNIPAAVTTLGNYAFMECSKLTDVTFDEGRTTLEGNYVFSGCPALTSVKLPESLTSLQGYVFGNAEALEHIWIPQSVADIGTNVFDCVPTTLTIHCVSDSQAYTFANTKGFQVSFESL